TADHGLEHLDLLRGLRAARRRFAGAALELGELLLQKLNLLVLVRDDLLQLCAKATLLPARRRGVDHVIDGNPPRLSIEIESLETVCRYTHSTLVQRAEVEQRRTISLVRGLLIPDRRGGVVRRGAEAPLEDLSHVVLRLGITGLGGPHPYLERRFIVGAVVGNVL